MITSRNRCEDLRMTLRQLSNMSPAADEILVTADGCTDDTVSMVRTEFPHCHFRLHPESKGSIFSRDEMLKAASGELVVSLDDDSYPVSPDFFARLSELFEEHPEAAVIAFPELLDGGVFFAPTKTPECSGHYVSAYASGSAALRRQTYLELPGYPTFFTHAYEEPDYAAQCYANGMAVWFEPSLTIRHHVSQVNRDHLRTHHFNARNELWSVWLRCPWPWLPVVSLFRIVRQFGHACKEGLSWVVREPLWWWRALGGVKQCLQARAAIPWRTYFCWMRLARQSVVSLPELKCAFGDSEPKSSSNT
jgi:glycosyltransferase involved in cell wall biosynthesis